MAPQNDEANLARIRDNQRRSRARRKEYQQELEQRVRAFEEQGIEASTEVQQAARRVAEENKKLRALLRHSGVGHASIEAFLRTGDFAAVKAGVAGAVAGGMTVAGDNVQVLEHLMVPRFPLQYTTSPLLSGSLSATGSVGPSSPSGGGGGGSGGGEDSAGGGYFHEVSGAVSATSSPPLDTATSKTGSGSSHGRSSHSHHGHGHRSSTDKGKKMSSSVHAGALTTTTASTAASGSYLSPGYGLPTAFYGLDATSAEDLQQYGAPEPAFFDYSVSPQYLGDVGSSSASLGGTSGTGTASNSLSGVTQPTVSAPYYAMPGLVGAGSSSASYSRTCPACMSGMGCQVHGGFFEE